jgi:coenzyme F420-0:L-glutamate ligase/coenzyme F420-1:gamma-L-glutamate ligase
VPHVCIVEHRLGHVMANGGIDQSNVCTPAEGRQVALLLPEDPDRSAARLRQRLEAGGSAPVGVVISDSFGRPWRLGSVGVAIGIAGPAALVDRRGDRDLFGRTLEVTEIGLADAIAAAAVLAMGEADEGSPVAILRGLPWADTGQRAADVLRPRDRDLFR